MPTYDWLDMDDITNSTVQGWMNSPGHRENILNSNYFSEGIGISISTNGHVYITENFF